MDGLDSWLNRQRGPSRALLVWLHMWITAIGLGSALWSFFGSGTPGLGLAFLEVVAWSALAAMPPAALIIYLLRSRTVGPGKRGAFSWRVLAAMLLFLAVIELNILTDQQAYWPHIHRVIGVLTLLVGAVGVAFGLMAASRTRRRDTNLLDNSQGR